jgi:hypothetical protein
MRLCGTHARTHTHTITTVDITLHVVGFMSLLEQTSVDSSYICTVPHFWHTHSVWLLTHRPHISHANITFHMLCKVTWTCSLIANVMHCKNLFLFVSVNTVLLLLLWCSLCPDCNFLERETFSFVLWDLWFLQPRCWRFSSSGICQVNICMRCKGSHN